MNNYTIKDWLSAELQKVHSVVIYVNPAVSGITAPASLTSKPSFTLQLSNHFDRPLVFRDEDLKSDFLFENGFETCLVPWNSIWAAHPDNEFKKIVFWNENSPGEGWDKALSEYLEVDSKALVEEPLHQAEPLKVLAKKDEDTPTFRKTKPSRAHLKLVK